MNELFEASVQYRDDYRWSIIPVKGKKPNLRAWSKYKKEVPSVKELKDFTEQPGTTGLGVICGEVSEGLVVRDFDRVESYGQWRAENRSLAKVLPTVRTKRGFHVYFRCPTRQRIVKLGDGEFRGNGYVVAPPSRVERGRRQYEWVVAPGKRIPVVDNHVDAQLSKSFAADAQSLHASDPSDSKHPLHVSEGVPATVDEAIFQTLPTGPGQRNHCIFRFARTIKAMEPDAPPDRLREIVAEWHGQASPVIRTKDFLTTWNDFIVAWERVRSVPLNMAQIVAEARNARPPMAAMRYDEPKLQLLVTLCACMQRRWGTRPFFLSVRTAAKAVGANKDVVWRWLKMLEFERILSRVKMGCLSGHKASEWLYLGDQIEFAQSSETTSEPQPSLPKPIES